MSKEDDIDQTPRSIFTSPLIENEIIGIQTEDIEEVPVSVTAHSSGAKATVNYINNIKIFLTNVVILNHCACPFGLWPGLYTMTKKQTIGELLS